MKERKFINNKIGYTEKILRVGAAILCLILLQGCHLRQEVSSINIERKSSWGKMESAEESLQGKTWLVIGDSISAHTFRAEKNYDEYIAEELGVKGTAFLHTHFVPRKTMMNI